MAISHKDIFRRSKDIACFQTLCNYTHHIHKHLTFFWYLVNIITVFLQGFPFLVGRAAFFFVLAVSPADNFKGSKGRLPPNTLDITDDSTAVAFLILDKILVVFWWTFGLGLSVLEAS